MSTSLHRFFVHSNGHDEPRQVLTPLLLELGLRIVDEPEPDLITRVVRVWRSGDWIVIDDEGGELGEDARDSRRWRTRALAVQVLHSDVAVVERYDSNGRIGSVNIRPSGGAPKKVASVFSGLMTADSADALDAAFAAEANGVESKLERVFEALGLPSAIEVPSQTEVLVLTDGRTRRLVAPSAAPILEIRCADEWGGLSGVERRRLHSPPGLVTIGNTGGYASSLLIRCGGSALEDGLLEIDRIVITQPRGSGWESDGPPREISVPFERSGVEISAESLASAGDRRRLDNHLPENWGREEWRLGLIGTRRSAGVGELVVSVSAGNDDAVEDRSPVTIVQEHEAPHRIPLDEVGFQGQSRWAALVALRGDTCLAATVHIASSGFRGNVRASLLEAWAGVALTSQRHDILRIEGDISGVRTLKRGDIGRGSRWTKLVAQQSTAQWLAIGPPDQRQSLHDHIRTAFRFWSNEPDLVLLDLDLADVDGPNAWRSLQEAIERGVTAGEIRQATITLCAHPYGASRYEFAVSADHRWQEAEYLREPGRIMYLTQALIARLDEGDLHVTFEVESVADLIRLTAREHASMVDIERVVTPILRPTSLAID